MSAVSLAAPARLSALKAALSELRYDQPLGLESAPLVERLLDDLTASRARQKELGLLNQQRSDEVSVAEQSALPVRKENARLVRENNELHMQLIADAEAAQEARETLASQNSKLEAQSEQRKRKL